MKPHKSDIKFLAGIALFGLIIYLCSWSVLLAKFLMLISAVCTVVVLICILLGASDDATSD